MVKYMRKRSLKSPTKSGRIQRSKIRSAIKALHVWALPTGAWMVKKISDGRVTRTFPSKEQAVAFGQSIAQAKKRPLIIHTRDGRIQHIDTRSDPMPARASGSKH